MYCVIDAYAVFVVSSCYPGEGEKAGSWDEPSQCCGEEERVAALAGQLLTWSLQQDALEIPTLLRCAVVTMLAFEALRVPTGAVAGAVGYSPRTLQQRRTQLAQALLAAAATLPFAANLNLDNVASYLPTILKFQQLAADEGAGVPASQPKSIVEAATSSSAVAHSASEAQIKAPRATAETASSHTAVVRRYQTGAQAMSVGETEVGRVKPRAGTDLESGRRKSSRQQAPSVAGKKQR
mmetsp:Transcript_16345/g.49012  ORF Transcript_16345/g.49012 Transcript_16345/m.49012 type:complete len:238 (+) Transcript_16345:966-1679(+)